MIYEIFAKRLINWFYQIPYLPNAESFKAAINFQKENPQKKVYDVFLQSFFLQICVGYTTQIKEGSKHVGINKINYVDD